MLIFIKGAWYFHFIPWFSISQLYSWRVIGISIKNKFMLVDRSSPVGLLVACTEFYFYLLGGVFKRPNWSPFPSWTVRADGCPSNTLPLSSEHLLLLSSLLRTPVSPWASWLLTSLSSLPRLPYINWPLGPPETEVLIDSYWFPGAMTQLDSLVLVWSPLQSLFLHSFYTIVYLEW